MPSVFPAIPRRLASRQLGPRLRARRRHGSSRRSSSSRRGAAGRFTTATPSTTAPPRLTPPQDALRPGPSGHSAFLGPTRCARHHASPYPAGRRRRRVRPSADAATAARSPTVGGGEIIGPATSSAGLPGRPSHDHRNRVSARIARPGGRRAMRVPIRTSVALQGTRAGIAGCQTPGRYCEGLLRRFPAMEPPSASSRAPTSPTRQSLHNCGRASTPASTRSPTEFAGSTGATLPTARRRPRRSTGVARSSSPGCSAGTPRCVPRGPPSGIALLLTPHRASCADPEGALRVQPAPGAFSTCDPVLAPWVSAGGGHLLVLYRRLIAGAVPVLEGTTR